MKKLLIAIVFCLLLPVILGVQPAMAAADWPAEPLITDPSGDTLGRLQIDILKVYVTHDSENLYVDVQGSESPWPYPYVPYVEDYTDIIPGTVPHYSKAYIHLNDLTVQVWDDNPTWVNDLQSTPSTSVQAPCMVTIPLELLGSATHVDIWVETEYGSTDWNGNWYSIFDQAPDTSHATYTLNGPPEVNSVTTDPAQLWPPNNKPRDVTITVDATDPNGLEDIVSTTYSVADEYGIYDVPETDLPNDGVISLIAGRYGTDMEGRVYAVTVTVYDSGMLSDSDRVDVIVPHH